MPGGQYAAPSSTAPARSRSIPSSSLAKLKERGRARALIVTGCLTQRYGQDILTEIPEVSAILGTSELDRDRGSREPGAMAAQDWVSAAPPGLPLRCGRRPRLLTAPRALRLREDRRGLRHGLHVLRDPAVRGHVIVAAHPATWSPRWKGSPRAGSRRPSSSPRTRWPTAATSPGTGTSPICCSRSPTRRCRGSGPCTSIPRTSTIASSTRWARARVVPYLDMPVQHGDDGVLRAMRRAVTARRMKEIVGPVPRGHPGRHRADDGAGGLPGETEAAFDNLLGFVEDVAFDRLGVFTYSTEEGTPAAIMADPGPGGDHDRAGGPGGGDPGSPGLAAPEGALRHDARPCWWTGPAPTARSPSRDGWPARLPRSTAWCSSATSASRQAASRRSASSKWTATSWSEVARARRGRRARSSRARSTASHLGSPPGAAPATRPVASGTVGSSVALVAPVAHPVHAHGARSGRTLAVTLLGIWAGGRVERAPRPEGSGHHRDRRGRGHGAVRPLRCPGPFPCSWWPSSSSVSSTCGSPSRRARARPSPAGSASWWTTSSPASYALVLVHGRRAHSGARVMGVRIVTVGVAELAGRDDAAGLAVARALRADGVPVASRAVVDEDEAALEAALGPALDGGGVVVVLAPPAARRATSCDGCWLGSPACASCSATGFSTSSRRTSPAGAARFPAASSAWPSCRKAPSSGRAAERRRGRVHARRASRLGAGGARRAGRGAAARRARSLRPRRATSPRPAARDRAGDGRRRPREPAAHPPASPPRTPRSAWRRGWARKDR